MLPCCPLFVQTMCKREAATSTALGASQQTQMQFVADGWSGKGTGSDWCNHCVCSKAALSCTAMACGINPRDCLYDAAVEIILFKQTKDPLP